MFINKIQQNSNPKICVAGPRVQHQPHHRVLLDPPLRPLHPLHFHLPDRLVTLQKVQGSTLHTRPPFHSQTEVTKVYTF